MLGLLGRARARVAVGLDLRLALIARFLLPSAAFGFIGLVFIAFLLGLDGEHCRRRASNRPGHRQGRSQNEKEKHRCVSAVFFHEKGVRNVDVKREITSSVGVTLDRAHGGGFYFESLRAGECVCKTLGHTKRQPP